MSGSEIVVIGGGISGCAAAWELAREGHAVTLFEAARLAAMASGQTLGGVRQSGRHPAELPLATAAVGLWADLATVLDGDTGYRRCGNLRLARSEQEAEQLRAMVSAQQAQGLQLQYLASRAEINELAPALGGRVIAASYCPSDGAADPPGAVRAFAAAARRAGAVIEQGCRVEAVTVAGGAVSGVLSERGRVGADCVIVAAGVHTPALLEPLGLVLPLTLRQVAVLQSVPLPPLLGPVFGVANADCAGRQENDGRLRVTTGLNVRPQTGQPPNPQPTGADIVTLIERVGDVLPALRQAPLARLWGGLIDLTPDGLPVIDAPPAVAGLVVCAGFSGHGFCLGPVTGQLAADLALGRAPRHPLDAFRLARWPTGVSAASGAELTLHG